MTHIAMAASSEESRTPPEGEGEKGTVKRIENVHTNERVPGHPGYYEKGGLRTYGDDEDHDHEPPVCLPLDQRWTRLMA